MKKTILLSLMLGVFVASGFAQLDPFMPRNAITFGQGGSFTANGEGYNAFFYNPAGFGRRSELTLASVDVYGLLDKNLLDMVVQAASSAINGVPSASLSKSSRFDLPPGIELPAGIDVTLVEGLITDVTTYITDVNAADPNAIENALIAMVEDNPALVDIANQLDTDGDLTNGVQIDPGIDPASLITTVLTSDVDLTGLLNDFIESVEDVSGVAPPASVAGIGDTISNLVGSMFPAGNIMAGVSLGVGYVGNGLGIGLFANAEANLVTPEDGTMLDASGSVLASVSLAGGMAFKLFDGFDLGFSVRPTILGYTAVDPGTLIGSLMSQGGASGNLISSIFANSIYKGLYLGIDVGVLWDLGPFTLGAALKDINPFEVQYSAIDPTAYASLEEALTELLNVNSGTPAGDGDKVYKVPPFKLNLGVQFHPDLGVVSQVFDPRIGLDFMDVFGFVRSADDLAMLGQAYNFLDHINLGAEVELLGIIDVRAGFYQAAFTAGLGFELPVLHVNAAIALDDLNWDGIAAGADPVFQQLGFSLELALRFPEAKTAANTKKDDANAAPTEEGKK